MLSNKCQINCHETNMLQSMLLEGFIDMCAIIETWINSEETTKQA